MLVSSPETRDELKRGDSESPNPAGDVASGSFIISAEADEAEIQNVLRKLAGMMKSFSFDLAI